MLFRVFEIKNLHFKADTKYLNDPHFKGIISLARFVGYVFLKLQYKVNSRLWKVNKQSDIALGLHPYCCDSQLQNIIEFSLILINGLDNIEMIPTVLDKINLEIV